MYRHTILSKPEPIVASASAFISKKQYFFYISNNKMHVRHTRSLFRTRISSSYDTRMESILLRKSCTVDMTGLNSLIIGMLTD